MLGPACGLADHIRAHRGGGGLTEWRHTGEPRAERGERLQVTGKVDGEGGTRIEEFGMKEGIGFSEIDRKESSRAICSVAYVLKDIPEQVLPFLSMNARSGGEGGSATHSRCRGQQGFERGESRKLVNFKVVR